MQLIMVLSTGVLAGVLIALTMAEIFYPLFSSWEGYKKSKRIRWVFLICCCRTLQLQKAMSQEFVDGKNGLNWLLYRRAIKGLFFQNFQERKDNTRWIEKRKNFLRQSLHRVESIEFIQDENYGKVFLIKFDYGSQVKICEKAPFFML